MPRESTRWTPRLTLLEGDVGFEVQHQGPVLRVTLLGVFDRDRLARLRRRIAPDLVRRGRRIVLDGRRLRHVDYRTVAPLTAWNAELRSYGHELLLSGWSSYLKTILLLGDAAAAVEPATGARRAVS